MTDEELAVLLEDLESDRVERKESLAEPDRVCEAICAFANDLPDHRKEGVIFIGARNDGSCAGISVDDGLLLKLSHMRDDGRIHPLPSMVVQKRAVNNCVLAVVIVTPSSAPPVRFRGRTWIRVGPRRAVASLEEERRLIERHRGRDLPFDLQPVHQAKLDDLNLDFFLHSYLPASVAADVLAQNERSVEDRMKALRLLTPEGIPTVLGVLVLAVDPRSFLPGNYVQFLRIDGSELSDPIRDQKEIAGPISELLRRLDEVLEAHNSVAVEIAGAATEVRHPEYPMPALQQLVRNAVMHRQYDGTNSPARVTWFADRIEIQNPGGPFGQVTRENFGFPGITDYRNPHLAEAMKVLGFVQRFGVGIAIARKQLERNGNPLLELEAEQGHVLARARRRP
ncbi:MAG: ATP-binding protein [Pseudomonadota bacterium]